MIQLFDLILAWLERTMNELTEPKVKKPNFGQSLPEAQ